MPASFLAHSCSVHSNHILLILKHRQSIVEFEKHRSSGLTAPGATVISTSEGYSAQLSRIYEHDSEQFDK